MERTHLATLRTSLMEKEEHLSQLLNFGQHQEKMLPGIQQQYEGYKQKHAELSAQIENQDSNITFLEKKIYEERHRLSEMNAGQQKRLTIVTNKLETRESNKPNRLT
jgi:hypothetical protein